MLPQDDDVGCCAVSVTPTVVLNAGAAMAGEGEGGMEVTSSNASSSGRMGLKDGVEWII